RSFVGIVCGNEKISNPQRPGLNCPFRIREGVLHEKSKRGPLPSSVEEGKPRPRSASPTGRASSKGPRLGGAVQENQSLDQHHLGASRHSSSSEEESFVSAKHFWCKAFGGTPSMRIRWPIAFAAALAFILQAQVRPPV